MQFTNAVARVRESGDALQFDTARQQLRRDACRVVLPPAHTRPLTPHEVQERARQAHLRIGWSYQCQTCEQWHLRLAGGYALTTNGVAATAYHVAEPPRDARRGFLIAADDADHVFAVVEILAANRYADTVILCLRGEGFTPLPLSTNARPGGAVYCLSDPVGRRGYFSQGAVERIVALPARRQAQLPGAPEYAPTRILVSADWGRGSSGSAVLDVCGNAIGHVSTLSQEAAVDSDQVQPARESKPASLVIHEAASARDLLRLVKPDGNTPR